MKTNQQKRENPIKGERERSFTGFDSSPKDLKRVACLQIYSVCPFKYLLYMKRQTHEKPPQNKTKKDFTVQVCKIKTWTGTIPSFFKKRMWFIQDERRIFAMNNILFSCFWSSLTDFKQFSLVSTTKYVLALTIPTIFSLTSLAKNARKSHRTN